MKLREGYMLVFLFITVSLINTYLLGTLGALQVPTAYSLIGRGVVCALCALVGGIWLKERIKPRQSKIQVARFLLAGFGLWTTLESYQYARTSEIALISRLDIPIIILFGFLISFPTSKRQKKISFLLIILILCAIRIFSDAQTTLYGLCLAAIGALTLSLSYLLLKRSARTESAAVVSLIPALASIVFGALMVLTTQSFRPFPPQAILFIIISGFAMYIAYRIIQKLYQNYRFLSVQTIYVLLPILSIPIDLICFGHHFRWIEYGVFLIISIGVIFVCLQKPLSQKINVPTHLTIRRRRNAVSHSNRKTLIHHTLASRMHNIHKE